MSEVATPITVVSRPRYDSVQRVRRAYRQLLTPNTAQEEKDDPYRSVICPCLDAPAGTGNDDREPASVVTELCATTRISD